MALNTTYGPKAANEWWKCNIRQGLLLINMSQIDMILFSVWTRMSLSFNPRPAKEIDKIFRIKEIKSIGGLYAQDWPGTKRTAQKTAEISKLSKFVMLYRNQENFKSVVLLLSTCPVEKNKKSIANVGGVVVCFLYRYNIERAIYADIIRYLYGTTKEVVLAQRHLTPNAKFAGWDQCGWDRWANIPDDCSWLRNKRPPIRRERLPKIDTRCKVPTLDPASTAATIYRKDKVRLTLYKAIYKLSANLPKILQSRRVDRSWNRIAGTRDTFD